jgi:hypothetical protein
MLSSVNNFIKLYRKPKVSGQDYFSLGNTSPIYLSENKGKGVFILINIFICDRFKKMMYKKMNKYVIDESQKKHIKIKRTRNRHGRLVECTKVMD